MSDPNDVRRRTANRRKVTLGPDDIITTELHGGATVTVDTIDRTITIDAPVGGDTGGWKVADNRRKRSRNS